MHRAVVYIDPTGPTPVGFAQAAGMPGDIRFDFKAQSGLAYANIVNEFPQLVLKPFTAPYVCAYDIVVDDPTGASGVATVPGVIMNDRFGVEVYTRDVTGVPQRMIASGRVELNGSAYTTAGPLGPTTYPVGPSGPKGDPGPAGAIGPQGEEGVRGSRWYTGAGAPILPPTGRVDGDMWLDETTGDVWRWDATSGRWVGYERK